MADAINSAPPEGFDEHLQMLSTQNSSQPNMEIPEGFEDELAALKEEKYGTPTQQAITALEGLASGVVSRPVVTLAETKLLGIKPEDIQAREEVNPGIKMGSEAVGLIGSTAAIPGLRGVAGLGAGLELAGQGAARAVGLAAPKAFAERVGSAAVKGAVETALYQASDEASKMILDPKLTSEQALANIGLAGALGAAGGAAFTGAVSPLWKATVGNKTEAALAGITDKLNGMGKTLPEDLAKAESILGIQMAPEIKAANISDDGFRKYADLKTSQNQVIKQAEEALRRDASESVVQSLGKRIEDFQNYDVATAGREGMESFVNEYKRIADPITKEYNSLEKPFEIALSTDDDIANLSNRIVTEGNEKGYIGKNIPQQKVIDTVLERLPTVKNALDVKKLMTYVDNVVSENPQALSRVGRDVKRLILDTQQDIVGRAIQKDAPNLFERYVAARKAYKDLAEISNEAGAQLSIGKFTGPEGFLQKLMSKRSPEEFLRKLSPEGNAEIIPFLQKYFPQTLEVVKDNEFKKLVAPAIRSAKGDANINVGTLQAAIERKLSGQQAYVDLVLPKDLVDKTAAADYLIKKAIPQIRDSGSAGWVERKSKGLISGALGAVAWMTGNNPMIATIAGLLGEVAHKKVPEAYKLAMLRFIASDQPIKAEGFKSMIEMLHNAVKVNGAIDKATKAVFSGTPVLASSMIPKEKDTEKLNKMIEKYEKAPDSIMQLANSDVGYYMPEHQVKLSETMVNQINYLKNLKPKVVKPGPLDKPLPPNPIEQARYQRALKIANQPAFVLEHVRNGTVQQSDIDDLMNLYPSLYQKYVQKITDEMVNRTADEEPIPYKTRMGISLFLNQPVDSSMSPASILAAQPKPNQQTPSEQQQVKPTQQGLNKLGKNIKGYMTPNQSAEFNKIKD